MIVTPFTSEDEPFKPSFEAHVREELRYHGVDECQIKYQDGFATITVDDMYATSIEML